MTKSTEELARELYNRYKQIDENADDFYETNFKPYKETFMRLATHVQTLLDKAKAEARAECAEELGRLFVFSVNRRQIAELVSKWRKS